MLDTRDVAVDNSCLPWSQSQMMWWMIALIVVLIYGKIQNKGFS